MVDKYLKQSGGAISETIATTVSGGAGDAGKIIGLDSTGRIDSTMMPVGVVPEVKLIISSENLAAGNIVNLYDNSGTVNVRKADGSNGRMAHGFVLAATTSPASATVYLEGNITGLTSLTNGATYFISASSAGAATATAPSGSGNTVQQIGVAVSTTEIAFNPQQTILLA